MGLVDDLKGLDFETGSKSMGIHELSERRIRLNLIRTHIELLLH